MANSVLCVSCASMPLKDRDAAVKNQRCPACAADIGMTAYGGRFRIPPLKRRPILTPTFSKGAMVGAAIFMFVIAVVGLQFLLEDQNKPALAEGARPAPITDELARIPEVSLEDPLSQQIAPPEGKQHVHGLIAKIKAQNAVKQDGFLIAQIDRRRELRGLPFVMGDACRLPKNRALSFQTSVASVRDAMDVNASVNRRRPTDEETHVMFWNAYLGAKGAGALQTESGLAALSQILGPESMNLRVSLAKQLAHSQHADATKMLAKAAIFDASADARNLAIKALKDRPREQYSDVLLHGVRYPMAVVAKRAAAALILLDRKDLLPDLADFLGEAAPGDPVVNEQKDCTVREVVRINHHRNCLLCHAPGQTGEQAEVPGMVPSPGNAFPQLAREYYGSSAIARGEPVVRADTTYLRQDFSMMMPVENAAPWPDMQRFDFLVRTRVVEGKELAALQARVQHRADFLSENHQAAVRVLRELTGRDAAPTPAAWRGVLGINAAAK